EISLMNGDRLARPADEALDIVDRLIVPLGRVGELEDDHILAPNAVGAQIIEKLTDHQPVARGARRGNLQLPKIDLVTAIGTGAADDRIMRQPRGPFSFAAAVDRKIVTALWTPGHLV